MERPSSLFSRPYKELKESLNPLSLNKEKLMEGVITQAGKVDKKYLKQLQEVAQQAIAKVGTELNLGVDDLVRIAMFKKRHRIRLKKMQLLWVR